MYYFCNCKIEFKRKIDNELFVWVYVPISTAMHIFVYTRYDVHWSLSLDAFLIPRQFSIFFKFSLEVIQSQLAHTITVLPRSRMFYA